MYNTTYLTIMQGDSVFEEHKYTAKDLNRTKLKISVVSIISMFFICAVLYNTIHISYTPTASMAPTMAVGELSLTRRVFGENDLHRGDIVMFDPITEQNQAVAFALGNGKEIFVKRLIGLPGEHICIINDVVYINGDSLDEPYAAYPENRTCPDEEKNMAGFIIPDGCYFFMGDNRDNSLDSRYALGVVPYENIQSKVVFHFTSLSARILGTDNNEYFVS